MPPEYPKREQRVFARTVDGRRWMLRDLDVEKVAEEIALGGSTMLRLADDGYVFVGRIVALELDWVNRGF